MNDAAKGCAHSGADMQLKNPLRPAKETRDVPLSIKIKPSLKRARTGMSQ